MPRKVFTAGEVLAAADVNDFLMDQTVMVFAGTAARGSAIGTATEGMYAHLNDTDTLTYFDGTNWVNRIGSAGILQVVNATKTDVFTASVASAGTFSTDAFTISITPSSASSKVFITGNINIGSSNGNNVCSAALFRDGNIVLQGDAVGSRSRTLLGRAGTGGVASITPTAFAILDSPNTTSSVTYSIRISTDVGPGTVYLNRAQEDTDNNYIFRGASSMVAMEVAG